MKRKKKTKGDGYVKEHETWKKESNKRLRGEKLRWVLPTLIVLIDKLKEAILG